MMKNNTALNDDSFFSFLGSALRTKRGFGFSFSLCGRVCLCACLQKLMVLDAGEGTNNHYGFSTARKVLNLVRVTYLRGQAKIRGLQGK
ncbi:hypothetical protein ACOSQ3_018437 [Xanthoceras sorbifolium]